MGGSTKNQTVTNRTEIPDFLKPFIESQARMSNDVLARYSERLNGAGANDLVAPFNPNQQRGQQLAIDAANDAVINFNNPTGPAQTGINVLRGAAEGGWIGKMLPQFEQGISSGLNAQVDPGMLSQFANNKFQLDPTSQAALQGSAAGNGLYGSAGFDEAVQASIRAARPSILSGYAQGGSGAIKGGLAQIGMQQAASDSFARLYGDERNRQLSSASQLGNFDLAGRGQQIDAAGQIYQGNIQQQQMRNDMAMGLGGILSDERARQLQSAQALPQISLLGSQLEQNYANTLMDVGDQQQELEQRQLTAPLTADQMMIAALNGVPGFENLYGSQSTQPVTRNRTTGAVGGALTGFQVGGPWGALVGGLLGGWL